MCDHFLARLAQLIAAAGKTRRVVLSSTWRLPQHKKRQNMLEHRISTYLGEPFVFDDRTALLPEQSAADRICAVGDYIATYSRSQEGLKELRVLVLDDLFVTRLGDWLLRGVAMNSSSAVERYLKGQVELGVVSTVKFVHTYQKLATPVNVPVQIGCGLTLSCMCAAQELFGLGCPFCGRPDEGVTNQILDSKPNTNVSPEFLSESLWTSLCWQTSVPPKWWSFFRTVLCRVAHSFSPIPSDLWRTVEMTVETRVVDQQ